MDIVSLAIALALVGLTILLSAGAFYLINRHVAQAEAEEIKKRHLRFTGHERFHQTKSVWFCTDCGKQLAPPPRPRGMPLR